MSQVQPNRDWWKEVNTLLAQSYISEPKFDMGYDISDYCSLDPRYGDIDDMHHSSKLSPKRDWYIWRPPYRWSGNRHPPNNWDAIWGGSAWEWDENTQEYYLHLFLKEQPDLNWENIEVRRAVHELMRWWLDKVSGFRMDVINLISKPEGLPDEPLENAGFTVFPVSIPNGPRVHEFLREMNEEVISKYDAMTVGETPWTHDPAILARYVKPSSKELNMVFTFHHVDIDGGVENSWKPIPWKLSSYKQIINKWQTYMHEHEGWNSIFIENHDQGRSVSRFGNDSAEYRSISAKMLAVGQICQGGTIYVYQGEELGMANMPPSWGIEEYKDKRRENSENPDMSDILKDLRKKARDNARTPVQWDDSPHAGFTSENATPWMRMNDPNSVRFFWKRALAFRKAHPVLIHGSFRLISPEDERVFAIERQHGDVTAIIVINFNGINIPKGLKLQLSNYENTDETLENTSPTLVNLRPYEARVYL
ncbi:glycoside hydrolase superfamily [Cantharellus anzutake]|uniref:glycoside hydrolase superfamily n=1 Tax=Cantharellus anzutake TaxID=1750568 RepID=UPI001908289B|nr:glycoside hydrolase superfamily [Cantharellus anzutake]KAF8308292.1 glycoside hydrolase superfamily [Cantharellus anzutake]